MKWLAIVLQCVAACVVYGVIHNQFTVRICLEYFTIGHPPVFPTKNPTLLALGWGVLASWWGWSARRHSAGKCGTPRKLAET